MNVEKKDLGSDKASYKGLKNFVFSHSIADTIDGSYSRQEFLGKRGHIPGAEYLVEYKPEICSHKPLLEAIRQTGRVESITLEGEGSQGYVVQISDICLKFNNQQYKNSFRQELKNYKLIEQIYSSCFGEEGNPYFKIPELQKYLSDTSLLAMEYIPGLSLATLAVCKDHNIIEHDIRSILQTQAYNDDVALIKERLGEKDTDLMQLLKEHELRTLLLSGGIAEQEFENFGVLDALFLIEYLAPTSIKDKIVDTYKIWRKALKDHNILSIDDHGENLKLYGNTLYGLDFGNIVFTAKTHTKGIG